MLKVMSGSQYDKNEQQNRFEKWKLAITKILLQVKLVRWVFFITIISLFSFCCQNSCKKLFSPFSNIIAQEKHNRKIPFESPKIISSFSRWYGQCCSGTASICSWHFYRRPYRITMYRYFGFCILNVTWSATPEYVVFRKWNTCKKKTSNIILIFWFCRLFLVKLISRPTNPINQLHRTKWYQFKNENVTTLK